MDTQEFIEHYGIPGMKWGRRKDAPKRHTNRTVFEKAPNKLTDAELKRRIQRMEFEKKYNELNARDVSTGEKMVSEILANSGKAVVGATLTGAGLYAVKKLVEKKFGEGPAKFIPKMKK